MTKTFSDYLLLLIQFTESKPLVLSSQSEAFVCYAQGESVEYCGRMLTEIGMPCRAGLDNNQRTDLS